MRNLFRILLLSAALGAGAAFAQPLSIRFSSTPPLVQVAPGVQVVADYDGEVFFAQGAYWTRQGPMWFRAKNNGHWRWHPVPANFVPQRVSRLPFGRYRNFHPQQAWVPRLRFVETPKLVEIAPGIQVVANYSKEVFATHGAYWMRHEDQWFRSDADGRWGWRPVNPRHVPYGLQRLIVGRYLNYHPWAPSFRFDGHPDLVPVGHGIQVVADYDGEIFFANGAYWTRHDQDWFRTTPGSWAWSKVPGFRVPHALHHFHPGQFVHYRPAGFHHDHDRYDHHDHDGYDHHDHARYDHHDHDGFDHHEHDHDRH